MNPELQIDTSDNSVVATVVLDMVQAAIKSFPDADRKLTELTGYDYMKMGDERLTTIVGLKLGMVALSTEESPETSISYRFKFGDRGYVEYAAQAYETKARHLIGEPVILSGKETVLQNEIATQRLSVVGAKIISAASQDWPTLKPQLSEFRALRHL